MKKCPMCGNENDDIAKACTNCGTRLAVNPEWELKPNTPTTKNYQPAAGVNKQNNLTENLGYQSQVLIEMQNQLLAKVVEGNASINKTLKSINSWVTFLGLITLIGLMLGLFVGCNAIMNSL